MSRDNAPRLRPGAHRLARLRALPLGTLALVLLVLAGGLFPVSPLRDAVTLAPVSEATLQRSAAYVLLAPMSNVLDTMTLLSVRQHVALLLTLIAAYGLWWWLGARAIPATITGGRRAMRIVARIGVALIALVGLYAAMAVMPRPMAALDVGLETLAIDFHAHTRFSHDGRKDWTPEDVRAWHRNSGFGVAYITDHRTFEGARDGWANNPQFAGQGTLLLPGIEVVWNGEHVNVLDADRFYKGLFTSTLRDIDEQALTLASAIAGTEPVLIETLPGDLSRMRAARGPGTPGVRAIEIIDGAPRGLGQVRRQRARIIHLADSLNIALVAGSNHHGWGRTATGWTLMNLPRWRAMTPDVLASTIATTLRQDGRGSTRVVARYVADTESGVSQVLTLPLVVWGMMRTLSSEERVSWVMWGLVLFLLWRFRPLRRPLPAAGIS